MKNYNDEYYIVELTRDKDRIYAKVRMESAQRGFGRKKILPGGEPIFFENANSEVEKAAGIKHQIPDIILEAGDLVVNETVRDFLKMYDINGLQLYPAIYIDDDNEWHEQFWCLNFYEKLDCWDRKKSELSKSSRKRINDPNALILPQFSGHFNEDNLGVSKWKEKFMMTNLRGMQFVC